MSAARPLPDAPAPAPAAPMVGKVDAPFAFGRFVGMRRTDARWIVYDPARPFGDRTAWLGEVGATREDASAACKRLSAEATLRGEPNEPARQGFKWDWTDPHTWQREA